MEERNNKYKVKKHTSRNQIFMKIELKKQKKIDKKY